MATPEIQSTRFFRIRPEQIEHLHEESFPRQLMRSVRKVWPEHTQPLTDEALLARLETSIAKAKEHGIPDHDNITRYVHLSFLLGREDFDTAPETSWAGIILGWNMSETKKLDKLVQRAEIEQERVLMAEFEGAGNSEVGTEAGGQTRGDNSERQLEEETNGS